MASLSQFLLSTHCPCAICPKLPSQHAMQAKLFMTSHWIPLPRRSVVAKRILQYFVVDRLIVIGVRAPLDLGGQPLSCPKKIAKCPKGWGLKLGCKRWHSPFSHLMKLLPLEKQRNWKFADLVLSTVSILSKTYLKKKFFLPWHCPLALYNWNWLSSYILCK